MIEGLIDRIEISYLEGNYRYKCVARDKSSIFLVGRGCINNGDVGASGGSLFLKVFAEPSRTDCFLNAITRDPQHHQTKRYIAMLTDDEFYGYHQRLWKSSYDNLTRFDETRIEMAEPRLGFVYVPFIMRSQEPYEEEILLAMQRIFVSRPLTRNAKVKRHF